MTQPEKKPQPLILVTAAIKVGGKKWQKAELMFYGNPFKNLVVLKKPLSFRPLKPMPKK